MHLSAPTPSTLTSILLAVAGFFLVILATDKFGPGVSPDSINYIAAARSFANGQGFQQYDGSPFTHWPPLYSMILGAGVYLNYDILSFARLFNALVFGLSIFWFGRLASGVIHSQVMSVLVTASAVVSFPLLKTSVMVWSEPLFILLVLVFIKRLGRLHGVKSNLPRSTAMLAGLAAAACLQRYIGIALVFAGAVSLLRLKDRRWTSKLVAVASFCLLSLLPLSLWVVRNQALVGEAAGSRTTSTTTLLSTTHDFIVVWTNWFLPYDTEILMRIGVFIAVIGFILTFGVVCRRRVGQRGFSEPKATKVEAATVLIAYSLFLLIITSTIAVEPISRRYLAPMFPLFLLLVFKALEGTAQWKAQG